MTIDDLPDSSGTDERVFDFDAPVIELMIHAVQALDNRWGAPDAALGIKPKDWRPSLVADDFRVCHVHVAARLERHWRVRLDGARQAGYALTVAAPLECWQNDPDTLEELTRLGTVPIVLEFTEDELWRAKTFRSVPQMIAYMNLQLESGFRSKLGKQILQRALEATDSNVRGDMFEDLLAMLFSQVSFLFLYKANRENDTEEIDLIFGNRAVGRALPQTASVIVSAKNVSGSVGAPEINDLEMKMQNRRGQCNLGFLVTSGTLARTISTHIARSSRESYVIVPLGGADLDRLLHAVHLDDSIEALVLEAITG